MLFYIFMRSYVMFALARYIATVEQNNIELFSKNVITTPTHKKQ